MYAEGVPWHSPGLALGAYPGDEGANSSLPRRGCATSVPDIALVPFEPVQRQELSQLLLEVELLVMFALSGDLSLHIVRL
jgi:hypothetical protein